MGAATREDRASGIKLAIKDHAKTNEVRRSALRDAGKSLKGQGDGQSLCSGAALELLPHHLRQLPLHHTEDALVL